MGTWLAGGVTQGTAGPDEFRTATLWGIGKRAFFLHDGRTSDPPQAILAHVLAHDSPGSEADNIGLFNALPASLRQDILDFLT
jgi:CxxC motif-containing protein (DUF1111 family)